MNALSLGTSFLQNNIATDALTLTARTTVKNTIYNFYCPNDNTNAQLVVSKTETENQTYSVFIKFLGIVDERCRWDISISQNDKAEIPSHRTLKYLGSRSFSFKIVDGNYVKIKDYGEQGLGVGYIDLLSKKYRLQQSLPPSPIQDLIKLARAMPTKYYNSIRFNDSVVVVAYRRFYDDISCEEEYDIFVGGHDSLELVKCTNVWNGALQGMYGLSVEYNGKMHSLELIPLTRAANFSEDDIKWDGNRLYSV